MLLVVGIALTVIGLLATVGPLALDLGGTDASPSPGSTDDRTDADAGVGDGDGAGDAIGDGTIGGGAADGTDGTDGDGDSASRGTIGGTIPEGGPQVTDGGANLGQCLVG